ncbi:hypothetical protein C5L38_07050 [Streptomyces sp. WAC00288]|nr:hypothetical protein C5L38_07050 [Streptomyces sp. WAC00288]
MVPPFPGENGEVSVHCLSFESTRRRWAPANSFMFSVTAPRRTWACVLGHTPREQHMNKTRAGRLPGPTAPPDHPIT